MANSGGGVRIVRTVGVVTIASFASAGVSFIKLAVVAAYLGATWQMDLFLWAFALITWFSTIASSSLTAVIVPVYLSLKARDARLAQALVNSLMGWLLVIFGGVSLLLSAAAPLIVTLLANDFSPSSIRLAVHLTWLMIPSVLFTGGWGTCQSVLNAEKSFFLPAISGSLTALCVIVFMLVSPRDLAVYAQAIGISLGAFLQWWLLVSVLRRRRLCTRISLRWRVEGMNDVVQLIWPLLVTAAVMGLLPVVDRTIASRFSEGSISALGYAQTLMTMSFTMFLASLQTAVLPYLSDQVANGGPVAFKRAFLPTVRTLIVILMPLSALFIAFQRPVVQIVLQRGLFDSRAVALTAAALGAYLLGVVPMAVARVSAKGFNALQDSRSNALLGLLLYVPVKLLMNLCLAMYCGYVGLALASSMAETVTAVGMLWFMRRKLGEIKAFELISLTAKALLASGSAALVAWWIVNASKVSLSPLVQLLVGGSCGLLLYWLGARLLKLNEVLSLTRLGLQFLIQKARRAYQ